MDIRKENKPYLPLEISGKHKKKTMVVYQCILVAQASGWDSKAIESFLHKLNLRLSMEDFLGQISEKFNIYLIKS